jgi:hypothetical protein
MAHKRVELIFLPSVDTNTRKMVSEIAGFDAARYFSMKKEALMLSGGRWLSCRFLLLNPP